MQNEGKLLPDIWKWYVCSCSLRLLKSFLQLDLTIDPYSTTIIVYFYVLLLNQGSSWPILVHLVSTTYAKNLPLSSLKFHYYFQPFPLSQVGCFYFYFYLLEYSLSTDLVIIWSIFAVDQPFLGNLGTAFFTFSTFSFIKGLWH